MIPSAGQGAIGIEVREQDKEVCSLIEKIYTEEPDAVSNLPRVIPESVPTESHEVEVINYPEVTTSVNDDKYHFAEEIQEEENLSLQEKELELIRKSLEKYGGRRKAAAQELGISERTLYRKIKQYNL